MRYPHTYSLLVVLSIFAVLALSGCDRLYPPNPKEPPLAKLTIIDITPDPLSLLPHRKKQKNRQQKKTQLYQAKRR